MQKSISIWLRWLRLEIGFDAWRFDFVKGELRRSMPSERFLVSRGFRATPRFSGYSAVFGFSRFSGYSILP